MVRCKHCGEEARFLRIDAGNHKDLYFCPECGRSGYLDVDFEYEDEEQNLIEQIKRRYNADRNLVADGPDVTWADFTLLEIIEALEKRVGQLEEQLANEKIETFVMNLPECSDCGRALVVDDEYMDDTFGPNWRKYVKAEDISVWCTSCGQAWVAGELIE